MSVIYAEITGIFAGLVSVVPMMHSDLVRILGSPPGFIFHRIARCCVYYEALQLI